MPYEQIYELGLLDDLHNYFPRILYRPEEFHSVQDVLRYLQTATQRQFNLFDRGRRLYENSNVSVPRNTHIRPEETNLTDFTDFTVFQTFLNVPARLRRTTGINSLFQDVVVNASQDLIERASTQITLEEDLEDNCPVCQDSMRQGELIRKLNACNHIFHMSCVDNWFLNDSVLCPTCRHDIRQPARVSPILTSSSVPPSLSDPMPNLTSQQVTTPPRATTQSPVIAAPGAPSRNSLRQRGSETQELLNALFNIGRLS